MSPRRRGRGRPQGRAGRVNGAGGGNGATANGAPSSGAVVETGTVGAKGTVPPNGQENAAADAAAASAGRPADDVAEDSVNGIVHLNGTRPDGDRPGPTVGRPSGPRRPARRMMGPSPALASVAAPMAAAEQDGVPAPAKRPNCTLAQMRRFIKSRPYVPVHELRRRFEIEGIEDEVSPVATERGTIYVGLPPEQAQFLGDLIKAGEVGCEMLLDPDSPAVVGVFPMRPVARQ